MTRKRAESIYWLRIEIEAITERMREAERNGSSAERERLEAELAERKTEEAEISAWIGGIADPYIRQIIVQKCICRRTWVQIALRMHTSDYSISKAYSRFWKRNGRIS